MEGYSKIPTHKQLKAYALPAQFQPNQQEAPICRAERQRANQIALLLLPNRPALYGFRRDERTKKKHYSGTVGVAFTSWPLWIFKLFSLAVKRRLSEQFMLLSKFILLSCASALLAEKQSSATARPKQKASSLPKEQKQACSISNVQSKSIMAVLLQDYDKAANPSRGVLDVQAEVPSHFDNCPFQKQFFQSTARSQYKTSAPSVKSPPPLWWIFGSPKFGPIHGLSTPIWVVKATCHLTSHWPRSCGHPICAS